MQAWKSPAEINADPELLARLENLFAEVKGNAAAIIVCSSVHRAKARAVDPLL